MTKREPTEDERFLFECVLTLKNADECRDFFNDLCTALEIKEMSRRLKAARMLGENKSYAEVAAATKLSTATISRVNRCLKSSFDGYARVLSRTKGKETE